MAGSAIALAVAGSGCKQKPDDAGPAAAALAGLAAMPAGVDQVVGLDVTRLAGSPLVERGVSALLAGDAELAADLDALLTACRLEVVRDVRRIWLGMERDGGGQAIMVVEGQLTEGQLQACVGKAQAASGGRLTSARVAGRTHYQVDQDGARPDVWFTVVGDGVVAVATSAALLAAAAGDGPKLAGAGELGPLIERAGAGHAVWFAGSVPPEVGAGLGKVAGGGLGAPRAMFGHLDLDGPLDAELGVVLASAGQASEAAGAMQGFLQTAALVAQEHGLGRLVHRVVVAATGDTVFLRLSLDEAEVRELVGTAIDRGGPGDQNAAPQRQEGVESDGQGDAAPGG